MANTSPRNVLCYHCRRQFEVSQKTMSAPCPHCHKPVIIEDVIVQGYKPVKTLFTCGRLIVRKGGRIVAVSIEAQSGIECNGALAASTISGGPVVLGAAAEWKGDLRAPSLAIKAGAKVLGGCFNIPDNPLAAYQAQASANVIA